MDCCSMDARHGESFPKKPAKVMLHNSNLMYTIYPNDNTRADILHTFFANALWKDYAVSDGGKTCSFIVDGKYPFKIRCKGIRTKELPGRYYVKDELEIGHNKLIPIWMLGLLY